MKPSVVGAALGTAQTLAWGSSYYLPAILADLIAAVLDPPITEDPDSRQRRDQAGTESLRTRRWRKPDSNHWPAKKAPDVLVLSFSFTPTLPRAWMQPTQSDLGLSPVWQGYYGDGDVRLIGHEMKIHGSRPRKAGASQRRAVQRVEIFGKT
jgi:hypothetical protein